MLLEVQAEMDYILEGLFFIMLEKRFDKILKDRNVCPTLNDTRRTPTILGIYREYLVSLIRIEFNYLDWYCTKRQLAYSSETYLFIMPGFISINKIV